jgi:hypothetical protein
MPMFMMPCSSFSYSNTRGVTTTPWWGPGLQEDPILEVGLPGLQSWHGHPPVSNAP